MNNNLSDNIEIVTKLKKLLDKQRPLPPKLVKNLKKDFLIKSTYHSNAIEGSTLTVHETKAILEDGITISGKSMKEHLEAINHQQAIFLTEDIVKNKEEVSERVIKEIHALVMYGIDDKGPGAYRMEPVVITGASHIPPSFYEVPRLMEELIDWYHSDEASKLHPIEKAAMLHSKLVNIHPFADGNGRTSRLLMNLELTKSGYLPVIIELQQRAKYYEVLDIAAVKGDYHPFVKFVTDYECQALNNYLTFIQKQQSGPEL